jgi:hypothetical protein
MPAKFPRARLGVDHGVARQAPVGTDAEYVDVVAVGLGRNDQLRAVGRERDLAGSVGELRRGRRVKAERPAGPGDRKQAPERKPVALDGSAVLGVQDVNQVAVHRHADRERAAGADDLAQAIGGRRQIRPSGRRGRRLNRCPPGSGCRRRPGHRPPPGCPRCYWSERRRPGSLGRRTGCPRCRPGRARRSSRPSRWRAP